MLNHLHIYSYFRTILLIYIPYWPSYPISFLRLFLGVFPTRENNKHVRNDQVIVKLHKTFIGKLDVHFFAHLQLQPNVPLLIATNFKFAYWTFLQ